MAASQTGVSAGSTCDASGTVMVGSDGVVAAIGPLTEKLPASQLAGAAPALALPVQFGRYRVEKLLGEGAMGSVYLAQDTELQRPVALKIPKFSGQGLEASERFFREARAAATLTHANICPVYDVGSHEGRRFLAMAYIDGRPLADFIKPGKLQPERNVAVAIRKLALALQEAHEHGIIHRDLKPGNIMINHRNEPIVMDFGLARRVDEEADVRITQEGAVVGTPAYMSPEQISGNRELGPTSDIFSLGVIFYELLTGERPFVGNVITTITQILHSEPKPIRELRPDVSPTLAAICDRALAKRPEDRFASMKQFAHAITEYLNGQTHVATGQGGARTDDLILTTEPGARRGAKSCQPGAAGSQQGLWISVGACAGTLALLALIAAAVSGGNSGSPPVNNGPVNNSPANVVNNPVPAAPAVPFAPNLEPAMSQEDAAVDPSPADPLPVVEEPPVQPAAENPPPPKQVAAIDPPVPQPGNVAPEKKPAPPAQEKAAGPPADAPPAKKAFPPPGDEAGPPEGDFPPGPFGEPPPRKTAREIFDEHDGNEDGKLDEEEIPSFIRQRADANKDRKVTFSEFEKAFKKLGEEELMGPPKPGEMGRPPRPPGGRPGRMRPPPPPPR